MLWSDGGARRGANLSALLYSPIYRAVLVGLCAFCLVVGAAAWYFLFALLALLVRGFNAYHTTTSAFFVLLMFVSNLFYPAGWLPGPLPWVAWMNPVTWQTDLLRHYTYGAEIPYLEAEGVALVLFTLLMFFLASRKLNGTIE